MKTIILFLIIILTTPLFVHSQWIVQNSGTTNALYDIEFINKNTGWACGANGKIIKTTNGGIDWVNQPNPSSGSYITGIHPVDSNIVYAVGYFETIMKSTNGGNNWLSIRNGIYGHGNSYESVFFIDENTGWIGKTSLWMLKTTDGGISFDSTYVFSELNDMYFKNANTGVVSGGGQQIYKTTDGGASWEPRNIPSGFEVPFQYKITFVGDYGWLVSGLGKVFNTTDFGDNWDTIANITSDGPYWIRFSSMNTGWVGGLHEELFKSIDGGYTWLRENTGGFPGYLFSAWFLNDSIGWISGNGGRILYTETSGQTSVKQISSAVPENFQLKQNYPNPFNPVTNIEFSIPNSGFVSLKIYSMLGKEISALVNSNLNPGTYKYDFDASNLTSGIYFYTLKVNEFSQTKKMLLVK